MSESPVHFEVLPNGLQVLLREAHAAPVAALQIWAKVGSADERPDQAGIAHFHEHMLFKGTARREVGEIAGAIEGLGGRINAYTSFDVTVYHATLPSTELALGVDVLVDAVRNSSFDPEEITREIDVVLEEIRRAEDTPSHVLGDAVFAETFQRHPYRFPILGSAESVAGFDRPRVTEFFRRWYSPDNLVFIAAGDFDARELAAQVRAAFADAKPDGATRQRPTEPPQQGLRSVILSRSFERASLELAFPTVGFAHRDAALLDLLGCILGEGDSSRLMQRVKEHQGLTDRIDAGSYTPLDAGVFMVSLELDTPRTAPALEAVSREIERVRAAPVTSEEIERARANFLASEHFERESVGGMARKLGNFHVLGGDWRSEAAYMETVRSATPADLQAVAQRYLAPERLNVGALLPESDADALSIEQVKQAVESGTARTVRALAVPAALADTGEIRSYQLPCGTTLHVTPSHDVPVVAVRAAAVGGLLSETREIAGITSFMTRMWMRGTQARSSSDLARAIEGLASDIDGFSGRSSLGLTLDVTSDRLEPALEIFAEVLLDPAFDAGEVERERSDTLAAISRRQDRLGARVFDLFGQEHFRSHPYGLPVIGLAETVTELQAEALVAHQAKLIHPERLIVGVAGDVDPDTVARRLSALFADTEGSAQPLALPPPEPPPPREIRVTEARKEDKAQAHLVFGFRGLTVQDDDRHALEVISQILAGQGGRLFLELRDRQSLAYSVSAMNVDGIAPGFFATYIATAPEKLDEAKQGMLDELGRLLEEGPDARELDRARRYLIGNAAIDEQRSYARAARTTMDSLCGLGPDESRRYPQQIGSVTRDDVLRVARRVIDLSAYTLAVIRP